MSSITRAEQALDYALAITISLAPKSPPLPTPDRTMWQYGKQINHYTAEQMMEYAELSKDGMCKNITLENALQREKELQSQVIDLRNELRSYREREKTMGWSQD